MRSVLAINFVLALSVPTVAAGQGTMRAYERHQEVYAVAPTRTGEIELRLDLYVPRDRPVRGAVVLVHGGSFVSGSRDIEENRVYGEALAGRGYLAAAISYRLHGDAPVVDGWAAAYSRRVRESQDPRVREAIQHFGPGWPDAVAAAGQDLEAAVAWLRDRSDELGFEPDDIAVFGASAGAITALTTAYALDDYGAETLPLAGVVDLRGLLLIPDERGGVLAAGDPPLMILHGEADERVPLSYADALHRRATDAGLHVQYFTAPGYGHELGGRELLNMEIASGRTVIDGIDAFLAAAFAGDLRPEDSFRGRLSAATPTAGALFSYRPHAGARTEFEDGYRRHLAWHRAAADSLVWYGWNVLAGRRLGMFVDGTFGMPFAALDARVDPAGDAANAAKTFLPHAMPTGRELVVLRRDLSTASPLEDVAPSPFVQVVRYRSGPASIGRLEEAFRRLRNGPEADSLLPYSVYEVVAGEEPGFLLMIWREGLGTFDEIERNPARSLRSRLADGVGADSGGRLDVDVTNELWRYRSDLTYMGLEEDE